MNSMQHNHFNTVRFLFALFVLITHSYPLTGKVESDFLHSITNNCISFSTLAVHGFFIISGYLITKSLLRSSSIWDYLFKRCIRIFPGLWFGVTLSVTMISCIIYFKESINIPLSNAGHYLFHNYLLITVYKIDDVFKSLPNTSINGSLWTIPYEFLCYLIIIPLFWVPKRGTKWILISSFLVLLIFFLSSNDIIINQGGIHHLSYFHIARLSLFFLAGACLSYFERIIRHSATVTLLSLLFLVTTFYTNTYAQFQYILLPLFVLGLCYLPIKKIPDMAKYGDFSYGIYLWGFPIQQSLVYLFRLETIELMLISIPLSCIFGAISWHFIEKRALWLKNKVWTHG